MSQYLMNGNLINVMQDGDFQARNVLPVGVYTIELPPMKPPCLRRMAEFTVPERLYGNTEAQTERIINTFSSRTSSTGVLLVGTKGSGKTLLSRNVSLEMLAKGFPTIIIPYQMINLGVISFLEMIDTQCVIIFDEIDKVDPDSVDTDCMLGMLDGLSTTKKLYVLTANDVDKINPNFLNRPGRIFYKFTFTGVSREAVTQYCEENLANKDHIADMVRIAFMTRAFSFDMLQSLVEECNRYGESPKDAAKYVNICPSMNGIFELIVLRKDGKPVEQLNMTADLDFDYTNDKFEVHVLDENNASWLDKRLRRYNTTRDEFDKMSAAEKKEYIDVELNILTSSYKIEDDRIVFEEGDYIVEARPLSVKALMY